MLNLQRAVDFVSRVKRREVLFGGTSSTLSPQAVEVMGFAGLDYVILGMEVESMDLGKLEDLFRAAEASGMCTMVKLRWPDPLRAVDAFTAGAQFVMAPHIITAEQVHKLIHASKFMPEGLRGYCPVARYGKYGATPAHEARAAMNAYSSIIPIIEDKEALDNIDEIAKIKEIDIIEIGPYDLSLSLGLKTPELSYGNKETMEAIKLVAAKAKENGKVLLGPVWGQADATFSKLAQHQKETLVALGFHVLYDIDFFILMKNFATLGRELRQLCNPPR